MTLKKINFLYFFMIVSYNVVDKIYGSSFMNIFYTSGLSIGLISIALSIEDFLLVLFEYPSGFIADKIGRKTCTSLGFFLLIIGFFIFIISKNFLFFIIAAFFKALGNAMFSGSPQSWYYEELKKKNELKKREKYIPILRSLLQGISVVTLLFCTPLFTLSSQLPIYIAIIVLLIASFIILFVGKDNFGEVTESNLLKGFIITTKDIIIHRSFWKIAILKILIIVPICIFIFTWQIILLNVFKQDGSTISILMIMIMLTFSLSSFSIFKILKYFRIKSLLLISILSIAFMCICIALSSSSLMLYIIAMLSFEFFLNSYNTLEEIWIQDMITSVNRASFYSALGSVLALVNSLSLIFLGFVVEKIGFFSIYIIASVFAIFASIYFYINFMREG